MISFVNTFISYLLLVVIMVAVAICGGFVGKKLRDNKNAREALKTDADKQD